MACAPNKSDRNVSATPTSEAADAESLARLLDQNEILEAFDEAIRRRFGQMISAAVLKPAKRHRRNKAA
jgi:hypothetical protein